MDFEYKSVDIYKLVNIINKRVHEKTNGLIKNLLNENDIEPNTMSILLNTVYFKSKWLKPFNSKNTKEANFTTLNGVKKCYLMNIKEEKFSYMETKNFQYVSMPYVKYNFEMGVILPKKLENNLNKYLSSNTLKTCMSTRSYKEVNLYIPKFEHKNKIIANNLLSNGGLKSIFSYDANFNRMVNCKFYVSKVIHECIVKVDEEYTEAAAVSAMMNKFCLTIEKKKEVVFKADRTFAYFIYHKKTKTVLFTGVYDGN